MFAPFVLTHKFLFIYSFIQQTFVQCLRHTRFRIFLTFYLFILLYNIVLVLPYISMNMPRVYTCSLSWTPLPLPFPYHPSGSSQCTSPEHPVSCIEPGLVIRFTYNIIHVSMSFSKSSHPRPFPQSPKDCSLYRFLLLQTSKTLITFWLLLSSVTVFSCWPCASGLKPPSWVVTAHTTLQSFLCAEVQGMGGKNTELLDLEAEFWSQIQF